MTKRYIWLAKMRQGKFSLVQIEVLKDTPKTFPTARFWVTDIISGSRVNVGHRVLKSHPGVFNSETEALRYLISEGSKRMRQQEVEVSKTRSRVKVLEQMIEESEEPK